MCKCKQVTGADTEIEWKRALEETSISSISSGVQPAVKPEPRERGKEGGEERTGSAEVVSVKGNGEGWTLSDIMMWKMTSTISYLLSKPVVIDMQCTQFLTEVTYRHTPRLRQVMQGAWYDKRAFYLWCSCWKIGTPALFHFYRYTEIPRGFRETHRASQKGRWLMVVVNLSTLSFSSNEHYLSSSLSDLRKNHDSVCCSLHCTWNCYLSLSMHIDYGSSVGHGQRVIICR